MKEIFVQKDMTYNLRNNLLMRIPKTRTSRHGIESLSYLGCKLWNNLPAEFKSIKTLETFKRQIKDGMIAATASYVENSLARSGS